jgi:hypothetical protein
MGRKWTAVDATATAGDRSCDSEITVYAAFVGAADLDRSELRRGLQTSVTTRVWHRVFPYLPREKLADGSMVLWHPHGDGWWRALDYVHAGRRVVWRCSGAYLQLPASDAVVLHDFADLDAMDIADWTLAIPHPGFATFCARLREPVGRLSELVARWALEVGPHEAGLAFMHRQ